jgi:hypothetical protein
MDPYINLFCMFLVCLYSSRYHHLTPDIAKLSKISILEYCHQCDFRRLISRFQFYGLQRILNILRPLPSPAILHAAQSVVVVVVVVAYVL